jgi:2-C-methyl-D-erythritol 4-phosphate cytidylyltransferase
LLRRAYARGAARRDATDDVQLVERLGGRVVVVAGDPRNLKITSREDLAVAELFCTSRSGGSARD